MKIGEPLRRAVEASVEEVLDRIAAENREPTAWEAVCLQAALIMMATNDYAGAQQAIERCARVRASVDVDPQPVFTIEDMRASLAMLRGWPSDPRPSDQD